MGSGDSDVVGFEFMYLFGDFPVVFVGLVCTGGGEVFVEGVGDVGVSVKGFVRKVDGDVPCCDLFLSESVLMVFQRT